MPHCTCRTAEESERSGSNAAPVPHALAQSRDGLLDVRVPAVWNLRTPPSHVLLATENAFWTLVRPTDPAQTVLSLLVSECC